MLPIILGHEPGGTSARTVIHFAQVSYVVTWYTCNFARFKTAMFLDKIICLYITDGMYWERKEARNHEHNPVWAVFFIVRCFAAVKNVSIELKTLKHRNSEMWFSLKLHCIFTGDQFRKLLPLRFRQPVGQLEGLQLHHSTELRPVARDRARRTILVCWHFSIVK